MTEIEVPIEKVQEDIQHQVHHHSGDEEGSSKMMLMGALMSAILAVFAAVTALFAGHYANEAVVLQIKSSDKWSYYQAKGIKSAIVEMKMSMAGQDSERVQKLTEKLESYKTEQEEIKAEAEKQEHESEHFLAKHQKLASGVTFFQIAIALTAIAVLARRKQFLYFSAALGALGISYLVIGTLFV